MTKAVPQQLRSAARTVLNLFLWILGILLVIYLFSGTYSIANNEVGVLQRFGKIIDPNVRPGIHLALPWPIDRVNKVPMPKVERIHIQDFSQNFTFGVEGLSFTSLTGLGTYGITGDNNLVNLECVLQYEVSDPVAYLFNLGDSVQTVERSTKRFLTEMACNTILHCLSEMGVDEALTNWERIVFYVKEELQRRLDDLESGLDVTFVEIKELRPPARVQEYFTDVVTATIDKKRAIKEAETYYEVEKSAAKGRAARLLAEGEAYYNERVQKAQGEAERFLKLHSEYRKDRELTRYRLYMESIQEILAAVERSYIMDTTTAGKPALIKLLK
jgi:membrane protease subunit HflK